MENRQESIESTMKDLTDKYDHVVAYMAQLTQSLLNLSKEKGVSESLKSPRSGEVSIGSKHGEPSRSNQSQIDLRGGHKFPKIDFPNFDGMNPREWIRKAERYFQLHGIEKEQQVAVAELYLQGKADVWFQGFANGRERITWEEFSQIQLTNQC
ncbi:hypothetical protein ACH5RR_034511 [Cinchona calisaya]|uniref:Retrotransposon gag domain-containing protein n=1 Tax=Cinchona calisaya TaxID=153742 RepID=A0ABD2YFP1_9GENT